LSSIRSICSSSALERVTDVLTFIPPSYSTPLAAWFERSRTTVRRNS
jgi:hypothetical protein